VTVTEAAKRLGVNKSTVSRQVKKLQLAGADGRFSYAAYLAQRGTDLNPLMARRNGAFGPEAFAGDAEAGELPIGGGPAPAPANALGRAHTAEKAVRARLLQVQLDEKLGKLCDRRGVYDAGQAAAHELVQLLEGRRRRLAEMTAGMTDPTEIEVLLAREDAEMLAALARTLAKAHAVRKDTDDADVAA